MVKGLKSVACLALVGAAFGLAGAASPLPFYVYGGKGDSKTTHWIASGYMGKTDAIAMDAGCTDSPHSGKTCIKVDYKANDNWGGVVWQDPVNDWGDKDGGFDLTGAKKLTFWAKGAKGGEKVKFSYGLLKDKTFKDSSGAEQEVTLTKDWKEYTIDLTGKDMSKIKTGFCWVVAGAGSPVTFYLDDIAFE